MMCHEYRTTYGNTQESVGGGHMAAPTVTPPSDPKPPDGDGWRLQSSAIDSENKKIYWFWSRSNNNSVQA